MPVGVTLFGKKREYEYLKNESEKAILERIKKNVAKIPFLRTNPYIDVLIAAIDDAESIEECQLFCSFLSKLVQTAKDDYSDCLDLDFLVSGLSSEMALFRKNKRTFPDFKERVNQKIIVHLQKLNEFRYLIQRQIRRLQAIIANLMDQKDQQSRELSKQINTLAIFEEAILKIDKVATNIQCLGNYLHDEQFSIDQFGLLINQFKAQSTDTQFDEIFEYKHQRIKDLAANRILEDLKKLTVEKIKYLTPIDCVDENITLVLMLFLNLDAIFSGLKALNDLSSSIIETSSVIREIIKESDSFSRFKNFIKTRNPIDLAFQLYSLLALPLNFVPTPVPVYAALLSFGLLATLWDCYNLGELAVSVDQRSKLIEDFTSHFEAAFIDLNVYKIGSLPFSKEITEEYQKLIELRFKMCEFEPDQPKFQELKQQLDNATQILIEEGQIPILEQKFSMAKQNLNELKSKLEMITETSEALDSNFEIIADQFDQVLFNPLLSQAIMLTNTQLDQPGLVKVISDQEQVDFEIELFSIKLADIFIDSALIIKIWKENDINWTKFSLPILLSLTKQLPGLNQLSDFLLDMFTIGVTINEHGITGRIRSEDIETNVRKYLPDIDKVSLEKFAHAICKAKYYLKPLLAQPAGSYDSRMQPIRVIV
ncbi:MAG: hypothetical protein JSR33_13170 [Proteobacteria bacterium]|nr:hypothetical protein [Pseudomonadota bacterium]